MTNILKALINIKKYRNNNLQNITIVTNPSQPRVNMEGNALDSYIRDAFCNSFRVKDPLRKMEIYKKEFSYFGSQNNPPDIIIRNSDAIEVKKLSTINSKTMQLNSSTPKSKLKSDSSLLTLECVNCEKDWKEKDILYAVGHVIENKLKLLTLVYGDCYAADSGFYEEIKKEIVEGIKKMNLPLSETSELGRLNNVDPLQRSSLRMRGMWFIKTPINVFSDIMNAYDKKSLNIFALMREEKFQSFEKLDKAAIENEANILNVLIKDPNSKKDIKAKLIHIAL